MSYCILDDLKKGMSAATIIQCTDDETVTPSALDPDDPEQAAIMARINGAISDADELINGHLRGRYTTPLPSIPKLLTRCAVDLVIYHLYARRLDLDMPEAMQTRYKNTIKLLENIRDGKISLGIENAGAGVEPGEYKTNKTASDRVFSGRVLDAF